MDTYGLGETIEDSVSGLLDSEGDAIDFTGYAAWFALSRSARVDWDDATITGTLAGGMITSPAAGTLKTTYFVDPALVAPDVTYTRWLKIESPTGEKRLVVSGQQVRFTQNPPQDQTT